MKNKNHGNPTTNEVAARSSVKPVPSPRSSRRATRSILHPLSSILCGGFALLCASAPSSHAQTATNSLAQTLPNFIQQLTTWGTSYNTNYNWSPVTVQIEDGYKQATGSGASDYLRLQYDLGKFNVGVEGEFLGVGSQFTAGEFEAGFALFEKYDFKIEASLLAGYDRGLKAAEVEPEIKVTKLITANTYATAGFSMPWFSKGAFNASGQFRIGAGFTF